MIQKNQRDSSKNHSRVEIICRITRQFVEPSYALKKKSCFWGPRKMAGTRGSGVCIYTLTEEQGALIYKQPCPQYIFIIFTLVNL